jgi:hypothetical protein
VGGLFERLSVESLDYDEDNWWRHAYRADFAPDALHKEDVRGGPPYGWSLPDASVDARVENEPYQTTFVDYLRICFAWSGFTGGADEERRAASQVLRRMAGDLLPI